MFGEIEIEENEAFLSGTDTVASFGSHLSPVTIENTQRGYHKGHSLKISSRNCNVRCTRLPKKITKKVSILSRTSVKAAFFTTTGCFENLTQFLDDSIFERSTKTANIRYQLIANSMGDATMDEQINSKPSNQPKSTKISYFTLAINSKTVLLTDISVHILLFISFLWARKQPVQVKQNIHFSEWEAYMNPFKSSQVSGEILYVITWCLPFFILLISFIYQIKRFKNNEKYRLLLNHIPAYWFAFADFVDGLMQYTLAVLLTSFTVQFIKFLAGRPRPDMFSRCWPDKSLLASHTFEFRRSLSMNPDDFIHTCKNDSLSDETTNTIIMNSAFKSFPSGHAGYSMAGCMSVALYLIGKFGTFSKRGRSNAVTLVLPGLLVFLSIYTGLTRLEDFKHHPGDILVGWAIGAVFAWVSYTIYFPPVGSNKSRYSYRQLSMLERLAD